MNEWILLFPLGLFIFIIWGLYVYPIQAMLKHEKMQLRKKELEIEKLRLSKKWKII